MPEAWREWEGKRAGDQFLLRRYLGGGESSGVFLTDWDKPARKAAIKLVVAEPDRAKTQLALWERTAELSHPRLLRSLGAGLCRMRGIDLIYLVTEYADEQLSQVVPARDITLPEVLPPPFQQIALHCLQPDPEDRWTVAEITTRLRYGLTVAAGAPVPAVPAVSPRRWKRALIWQAECPDCGSHDLTRSRRRASFEKTFSGVVLPYRCGRCDARFYRLRSVAG